MAVRMPALDSEVLDLLGEIGRFLDRHGMTETRFGIEALNDKPFVRQLREGRDIRLSTIHKVRHFMRTYRAAA